MASARARWRTLGLWLLWAAGGVVLAIYVAFFVQSMLGPEPMWPHLKGLLLRWQTFIAGCLALIAAGLTIRETRRAADRQVRAAGQQVRAAWEQIDAAVNQTEAMRTIERQRIAREANAFYAMMDAAMESVLADVEEARKITDFAAKPGALSPEAYQARTRVKQAGFSELRTACLHYGSQQVTFAFLRLGQAIDDLSSVPKVRRHPLVVGSPETVTDVGVHADLPAELNRIEELAKGLRDKVGPGLGLDRAT